MSEYGGRVGVVALGNQRDCAVAALVDLRQPASAAGQRRPEWPIGPCCRLPASGYNAHIKMITMAAMTRNTPITAPSVSGTLAISAVLVLHGACHCPVLYADSPCSGSICSP